PESPPHSVYTNALYSIAFLTTAIGETESVSVGTGVVLSENGRILTAYNAVYDPATQRPYNRRSQVKVGFSTVGGGQPPNAWYMARVVRTDRQRDMAILQIFAREDGSPLPNSFRLRPAPLGKGLTLQASDPIAVISYMGGVMDAEQVAQAQTLGIGEGQVLGFTPDIALQAKRGWIQSDIGLSVPNVGGLGLNQAGHVIGLYTGANAGDGGGLLRPIEFAQPLLAGL
ncbi:MAG TPA: trypsin-like peptidase domain-containing protein, partial [Caldilineae bacterium]|nr:trypsin-like peptidase domain-containing protein [Caldilineae bacterium]